MKPLCHSLKSYNIIWYIYVDDICAVTPEDLNIYNFINNTNDLCNSKSFTYELECDNKLPFLDCLVIKINNYSNLKIFRKPI